MKKYNLKIIILVALLGLTGCDSFLDVDPPASQLTGAVVFEDKTTATAAMVAVYSKLRDGGLLTGSSSGTGAALGLYSDELTYYGTNDQNLFFVFNTTLLPTTAIVNQTWNQSYHQIYCANAVFEGCQNSASLPIADKNQLMGEALFVRALVHFYLTNLYGDVPYITTTDYEVNRLVARMPVATVYENIISDLNEAIVLLSEAYVTSERVRPNRSVAQALLARVYLYKGDWAEASNAASAVLNQSLYVWENDIDKVFLKDCTATIWQFYPKLSGGNTNEAAVFIFGSGPPPFIGLNATLFNAFDPNDLRKTHWIKSVTNGTDTWYHAYKYKQQNNTGTSMEYSVVFRMAELYLIRTEARAQQGELTNAKADLNKVRSLAGLPDTTALTADELVAAVLQERKFELFTEYGHRFFDLKRTGSLESVLSIAKPGWNSTDQLWPIGETELLANPTLTQNAGY